MNAHPVQIKLTPNEIPLDVLAFGEPDDHLRLRTLLREQLGDWPPSRRSHRRLVLGDIDALYPGPITWEQRWQDATFHQDRLRFFGEILKATQGGTFATVTRSTFKAEVSAALLEIGVELPYSTSTDESALLAVSADLRPTATWLLKERVLGVRELEGFIEANTREGERADQDLLWIAWDALSPSARTAARRIAVLRAPEEITKVLGPFRIVTSSKQERTWLDLDTRDLEALKAAGFLIPMTMSSRPEKSWWLPNRIRHFLLERTRNLAPDELPRLHAACIPHANVKRSHRHSPSLEWTLENSHHALEANDIEQALLTNRGDHTTALRLLGDTLGRAGHFESAIHIFRHIVEHDPTDAYAWGALGHYTMRNLGDRSLDEHTAQHVKGAYSKAQTLDPWNPLHAGRDMGIRARQGRPSRPEFDMRIPQFMSLYGLTGAAWFARAALMNWLEGPRRDEVPGILEAYEGLLRPAPELAHLYNPEIKAPVYDPATEPW